MEVADGDLLIARLWRWDVDRLLQDAERDHDEKTQASLDWDPDQGEAQYYSVSAFGVLKQPGDDVEELMRRVCSLTQRNARYVAFTTGSELAQHDIEAILNEPPPGHYDLSFGTTLRTTDVQVLEGLLSSRPKRRFPTCEIVQAA